MRATRYLATIVAALSIPASAVAGDGFSVTALGTLGGIQDGNLSAWLIHPGDDDRAVTCDVGTLVNGLRIADEKGAFSDIKLPADSPASRVGYVLANKVKGYLVSHAHLDHVGGVEVSALRVGRLPLLDDHEPPRLRR